MFKLMFTGGFWTIYDESDHGRVIEQFTDEQYAHERVRVLNGEVEAVADPQAGTDSSVMTTKSGKK